MLTQPNAHAHSTFHYTYMLLVYKFIDSTHFSLVSMAFIDRIHKEVLTYIALLQSGSFIMNFQGTKIVFIIERLHNMRTQHNTNLM